MFKPKTKRLEGLSKMFPQIIEELEIIFNGPTNIYIDWQNVIHWQEKLGFNIHLGRFETISRFF